MPLNFLKGGGRMADAIADHDWSGTGLSAPEGWPPALKTVTALMLNSRFPMCIVWGSDLTTIYNQAFEPILGKKAPALGQSFAEIWKEAWPEIGGFCEKAFRGEATFLEDFGLELERFGDAERAWFTFCSSPLRDEHGEVLGMLNTVVETTGKVKAEAATRLLNRELAHRIKNLLTVVRAIAQQSARHAERPEQAMANFDARLDALAAAQDQLIGDTQDSAPVAEVLKAALEPHVDDWRAVDLDGPSAWLNGQQVLSLSLVTQELATNAVKFGALSREGGAISIAWGGSPADGSFSFRWIESGGPRVDPPARRGFGTRLIETVLKRDFRQPVVIEYHPDGVRCIVGKVAAAA